MRDELDSTRSYIIAQGKGTGCEGGKALQTDKHDWASKTTDSEAQSGTSKARQFALLIDQYSHLKNQHGQNVNYNATDELDEDMAARWTIVICTDLASLSDWVSQAKAWSSLSTAMHSFLHLFA